MSMTHRRYICAGVEVVGAGMMAVTTSETTERTGARTVGAPSAELEVEVAKPEGRGRAPSWGAAKAGTARSTAAARMEERMLLLGGVVGLNERGWIYGGDNDGVST
jgi:hypothetical protein